MFGRRLGFGDSFPVVITAIPYYQEGALRLRDVSVRTSVRETFYVRRARAALADGLSRKFSYPLQGDAKRLLVRHSESPAYRRQLESFQLAAIRVTNDAVLLVLGFRIRISPGSGR